jgi:GNAT superfamily N-acetyltransferase
MGMTASPHIALAKTSADIARCYDVMHELRTHIVMSEEFVERVLCQQAQGYLLAYLESEGEIRAAAGYRFSESLFSGKFMYVDDLVTRERDRSAGFGGVLFDWLVARAREQGCKRLELDSGVQRFRAHRFYLMNRMQIASHHFALEL